MTTLILNIVAIILGPIFAVGITLWYQGRKEKRDAKERLFLTLMTFRQSFPPAYEAVNALNLIDVVYASHPKVVGLWHDYYTILRQNPVGDRQSAIHTHLRLLSAMAQSLGYRDLEQVDIDKFYTPIAHENQRQINQEVQAELLRVLQNTAKLPIEPIHTGDRQSNFQQLEEDHH